LDLQNVFMGGVPDCYVFQYLCAGSAFPAKEKIYALRSGFICFDYYNAVRKILDQAVRLFLVEYSANIRLDKPAGFGFVLCVLRDMRFRGVGNDTAAALDGG
jgi:hypothetical protein